MSDANLSAAYQQRPNRRQRRKVAALARKGQEHEASEAAGQNEEASAEASTSAPRAAREVLAGYYTEDELAEQLGVVKRTLWIWRTKGTGPPITMVGRRVMYSKASVARWLESQERPMPRAGKQRRRQQQEQRPNV